MPGADRLRVIFMLFLFFSCSLSAQQISIPSIEKMPGLPNPYNMINWRMLAAEYDRFVYDKNKTGQYLPLIWFSSNTINYPEHGTFGLHTVVGTNSPGSSEAINVLPSLVGASLTGIDKSSQNNSNYVLMAEEFFNKKNGQNIYLNHPSSSSGDDWWYETMPNIFFYQLYDLYPNTGSFNEQFVKVADRWLQAVHSLGGKTTPWQIPDMNHRAFNFLTLKPNSGGVTEPEAAGAVAWILYNAYLVTNEEKYRIGAELAMEFLNSLNYNPSYEIQMPYGAFMAAKMNALEGTNYNIEKMVSWCFTNYRNRNWGVISGNWGGYDVHGLIGEVNGSNDYAFLMNTFQQGAALVPLVRYDDRFARAIGKWMLNAANAARLFYPKYLPDLRQDSEEWSHQNDTASVIAHEALRQSNFGVSPYATGDAVSGGWGKTNLTLYSSSHVGYFGGIIDTTNVEGILKLDVLKTDFFNDDAWPTFLLYNPYDTEKAVLLPGIQNASDIYDAVTNKIIQTNVSGEVTVSIPPDAAVLAVVIPASSVLNTVLNKTLVNGRVIDYTSGRTISNYPPRIKSLSASPADLLINQTADVYCTAEDIDQDSITFTWYSGSGIITGSGSHIQWKSPESKGSYQIRCIIMDTNGLSDTAVITINVSEKINSSPVINRISASPRKLDINSITHLLCRAEDPDGDTLQFIWTSSAGAFSEADSSVLWYSLGTEGNYYITCTVTDGSGGSDTDSIYVVVRDLSIIPSGNLIAYYPFTGNAGDQSGNSLNGIVSGAVLTNDLSGSLNSAYLFDGVDDNIRVPANSLLNFQKGISVNFWMRLTSFFEREQYPLSHGNWENRWKISVTNKRIRWTVKSQSGIKDIDSETELELNKNYNVCAVYDGKDFEIYLNGDLDASAYFSGDILQTSYDLMIGQVLPGNKNYNYKGFLDEIRIYDYGLPFSEIRRLYNTQTGIHSLETTQDYDLFMNYPNPFNNETTVTFFLRTAGDLSLNIYNMLGQKVRSIFNSYTGSGRYEFRWNGRDDTGNPVSSGIYFCVLKADNINRQIKLMMLK